MKAKEAKEEEEAAAKAEVKKDNSKHEDSKKEVGNQARGFVTPDEIHEVHGTEEKGKPVPRQ